MHASMAVTKIQQALILAVLLAIPASAERRHRWQNLKPAASQRECQHEFSDLQSKWLQAPLVVWVRLTDSGGDQASVGIQTQKLFNVTGVVQSVLKRPTTMNVSSGRVDILRKGSIITVGQFSSVLTKRRRAKQKLLCTPSRLGDSGRGYVFFLMPTPDPRYFRHAFLPAKFSTGNLRKFNRINCKTPGSCPKAPTLIRAIPKGVKPNEKTREISMRFVCRAQGEPLPLVRWLKDGVELAYDDRVRAQVKKRPYSIVSRLLIKSVAAMDAGTYNCQFSNLKGSVNSSFDIPVATILAIEHRLRSKLKNMPAYMCGSDNLTHCANGGTCVLNRLNRKPTCLCLSVTSSNLSANCVEFDQFINDRATRAVDRALTATTIGVAIAAVACMLCLSWYLARRRRLDQMNFKKRQIERRVDKEVQVATPAKPIVAGHPSTANNVPPPKSTITTVVDIGTDPDPSVVTREAKTTDSGREAPANPSNDQMAAQHNQQTLSQQSSGASRQASSSRSRYSSGSYDYETRICPVFDYTTGDGGLIAGVSAGSADGSGPAGSGDLLLQELAKVSRLEQQLYNSQRQQPSAYQMSSAYCPAGQSHPIQQQQRSHPPVMMYSPSYSPAASVPAAKGGSYFYSSLDPAPSSPRESDRLLASQGLAFEDHHHHQQQEQQQQQQQQLFGGRTNPHALSSGRRRQLSHQRQQSSSGGCGAGQYFDYNA